MPRGGKRPGAGRRKGTPNKATQKRQAEVAATGATPLDVILENMRFHLEQAKKEQKKGARADPVLIADSLAQARIAAKEAAPYVHPRLQAVTLGGEKDAAPIPIRMDSLTNEQLEQLIARIEAGSTI